MFDFSLILGFRKIFWPSPTNWESSKIHKGVKGVLKGIIEKKFKRVMMYQGKYSLMLTKLLAIRGPLVCSIFSKILF